MSLTPRIAKAPLQHTRQPREGDSRAHLAFIRQLPCCVCGVHGGIYDPFTQAHHLLRADDRPKGTGRKHLDKYAIPLCSLHHLATSGTDSAHGAGNDETWLAGHGIDGRALAAALWRASGDYDKGLRIVQRAKKVEVSDD